ncbi:MAG: L,D-transpeptidase [Gammaproteobacteria bacterium]|nr:L,D-transpeptidase [Gammaproteobacteria bacterium]
MRGIALSIIFISLTACSHPYEPDITQQAYNSPPQKPVKTVDYSQRLPQLIAATGEKVIVVNPQVHAWGAYSSDGQLVRGGLATAGGDWCPDIHRACHTKSGSFRIESLGSFNCISHKYPVPKGGAPMPYCMFFNGGQGLHGSYNVVDANVSHGCVRLTVPDAEWLRFNFVNVGTKVIVRPY